MVDRFHSKIKVVTNEIKYKILKVLSKVYLETEKWLYFIIELPKALSKDNIKHRNN